MNVFDRILNVFRLPRYDRNYWFYVRCNFCKEILEGRVDLDNHLSIRYGSDNRENTYYCRKVMIGSKRCYRPIEVEFVFDINRRVIDQQIKGGEFVSKQDYLECKEKEF